MILAKDDSPMPAVVMDLPFRADHFEFFRTTFGRRSRAQAERRLAGTDEPDPYLQHLFVFGPAENDIAE